MRKGLIGLTAMAASVLLMSNAAEAANITYVGSQVVGDVTATYSITTDGSIGYVNYANLIDYQATLSDSLETITLTPSNSVLYLGANATTTGLYAALGVAFISNAWSPHDNTKYAAALVLYQTSTTAQINDSVQYYLGGNGNINYSGFATAVIATPEAATWGMMIAGIGVVGAAMRRRQKVVTKVRYA